jgi:5'-nucleotidase
LSIPFTRGSSRLVTAAAAFGLVATPLALVPAAHAAPDGSDLVISEVYGGGGNSGATYNADFIELYNPTDSPISLAGKSIQYRAAGGTGVSNNVFVLPAQQVPAGKHFLIRGAGGSNGTALPTPDATSTLNLSGTGGQVYLADATSGIDPNQPAGSAGNTFSSSVIDFVGWGGSSTTSFEGTRAPATTNPSSVSRNALGSDTDDNGADFTVANPPGPQICDCPPPPPKEHELTIAEIQGEGDVSPYVGEIATTAGKVTATYPTGGFNGFYIQTPGTGGDLDLDEHDASHGIFVFSSAAAAQVNVGDYVSVKGNVVEYFGMTQLTPVSGGVTVLDDPAPEVKAATVAYPDNDADRETLEGMLIAPQGDYTVTDNYSLNQYGELGLASGTTTLKTPTEVARWDDAAGIAAAKADIAARGVKLDDGSSFNFMTAANKSIPLPYVSPETPVRVGAAVTFTEDVILDYRNNAWKLQPTQRVTGDDEAPASFQNDRTDRPEDVGGDVKIASFNVLNYFTETGEKYVAKGNTCSYYNDRDGNRITVNTCSGEGPRGAADATNLKRQQDKIVTALNALDADVVSLEEIENSAKFGPDRDAALSALVDALNEGADTDNWAFVPSPSEVPEVSTEDVIRNAFIYKKSAVSTVGESVILEDPAFHNARDPLAQAFQPTVGTDDDAFTVIVNHFKSKGSGFDDGTGQGNANPDRVAQAEALVTFAEDLKTELGTDSVFLSGDFNAYTMEQPMQVFYDAGYTNLGAEMTDEYTYLFGGTVGSLDHILANDAALTTVTGADIWNINSVEPIALEYSRYNYNATDFYAPDQFRASDHDPLVVGLSFGEKVTPSVSFKVAQNRIIVGKTPPVVIAKVSAPEKTVTGDVEVYSDGKLVGTGTLGEGVTPVRLPVYDKVGTYGIEVRYLGSDDVEAASASGQLSVVKPKPTMRTVVKPDRIRAGKTAPVVRVALTAPNSVVRGRVAVFRGGERVGAVRLEDGKARIKLRPYPARGVKRVTVRYLGSPKVQRASARVTIRVVR